MTGAKKERSAVDVGRSAGGENATGAVRFQVRRTSLYGEGKPCDEAELGVIATWDHRTFKSPEEHDAKLDNGGKWLDRGTEHGVVYGPRGGVVGIKRRLDDRPAWFVTFADLAALLAFVEKYGDCVLDKSWDDKATPSIEIYDDYRE